MMTAKRMKPSAFTAWMRRMKYNRSTAAQKLGVSRMSVRQWAKPQGNGAPPNISLACEALELRRKGGSDDNLVQAD